MKKTSTPAIPAYVAGMVLVASTAMVQAQPIWLTPEDLVVEKVVMLMRQGVGNGALAAQVEQVAQRGSLAFTRFESDEGSLSAHGRQALVFWGQYHRRQLAVHGLVPAQGRLSAGQVVACASPNQGSRDSADAFLDGLAPNSGLHVSHTRTRQWFMPEADGLADANPELVRRAVVSGLGMPLEAARLHYRSTLRSLETLMRIPEGSLSDSDWRLIADEHGLRIEPLHAFHHMVETARARYLTLPPQPDEGGRRWQLRAEVDHMHTLRAVNFNATRHPRFLAARHAAPLLVRLHQSLLGDASTHGTTHVPVVILVGRDTNIASMRALLRFQWETPEGLRNDIVPGGMLMFERLRHPSTHGRFLRISYHAPASDQIRFLSAFGNNAPPFSVVYMPPTGVVEPGTDLLPEQLFSNLVANVVREADSDSNNDPDTQTVTAHTPSAAPTPDPHVLAFPFNRTDEIAGPDPALEDAWAFHWRPPLAANLLSPFVR